MSWKCYRCKKIPDDNKIGEERENYYHIDIIGDLCETCYHILVKEGKVKRLKTYRELMEE